MTACSCPTFKPQEGWNKNLCRLCGNVRPSAMKQKPRTPIRKKSLRPKIRKGTLYKAISPETGRVVSVKTAKTRAWTAFARYIRNRDKQCVTCGAPSNQAGHYFHNSDKPNKQLGGNALWFDPRNISGQCSPCNLYKSGNLTAYTIYLEEKYGYGIVQELRTLFNTPRKWTIEELFVIAAEYEKKENPPVL